MRFAINILNLTVYCILSWIQFAKGNSLYCPVIYEHARTSCSASTQDECRNSGCCWDATASDIKCFQQVCKAGYFGYGCRYNCQCANGGLCDHYTGKCDSGCDGNKWGVGCLLDGECTYNDQFGVKYLGRKAETDNGRTCQPWTIQMAYPDEQFAEKNKTAASNFCRNPEPADYRTWCYYKYGANPRDRKWHYCHLDPCECPVGRWAVNCERECHCNDADEKCDQESGECTSGCAQGWYGKNCQDCADRLFGKLCGRACHCSDANEACDKTSGTCVSGCAAGWTGNNCQTECGKGYFGRNCEYTCNCAESSEVCDKVDGECSSGCKHGYTGTGCLTELPVMTRPLRLLSRTSLSVLVGWDAWDAALDEGDGPVHQYMLRFRLKSSESWEDKRTAGLQYNITFLELHKDYVIQVVPIRDGMEGIGTPELKVTTCGRPTSTVTGMRLTPALTRPKAPDPILPTPPSTNSGEEEGDFIIVSWRLPEVDTLGCDSIVKYKVYTWGAGADGYQLYGQINKTSRVTVSGVSQYSNYTIGVSFVNSAGYESEKAVQTMVGKSGQVENLQMLPSAHAIELHWAAPLAANGAIEVYLLRYRQFTQADCETLRKFPVLDLPPNFTTYTIPDLDPYSEYEVRLWVRTAAGKGQQVTRRVTTTGIAPSAKVVDLTQENVTSTTATFTWGIPPCEERNGAFRGYSVKLTDIDNADIHILSEITNDTRFEFADLIPFESYMLTVAYVNQVSEGPADTIGFRTLESIPPAPGSLRMKLTLSDKLIVGWETPDPPHGLITEYELKYWNNQNIEAPTHLKLQDVSEFTLTGLPPNVSYGFQVRAFTSKGPGPWSAVIYGFTEETYPSEPQGLTNASRTTDEITLEWTRPLKPNGLLREYRVQCLPKRAQGRYSDNADAARLASADALQYTVRDLEPGTEYTCKVEASTKKGFGAPIERTFFTLPEEPKSPAFPDVKEVESTDSTITLMLQPTEYVILNVENSVLKHRVVVEKHEASYYSHSGSSGGSKRRRSTFKVTPCNQKHSALTDYYTAARNNNPCYITAELSRQDRKTVFVVGDNRTVGGYYNAPLEKDKSYDLWFGVAVTVDGITSASYTKFEHPIVASEYVSKPAGASSQIPIVAGVIAGALLVIICLILVLVILISRRRKESRNPEQATRTESEHLTASPRASSHHEKSSTVDAYNASTDSEGEPEELDPLTGEKTGTLRKPFAVEHLWNYVRDKKASKSNGFKQEYEEIPQNLRAPCDHARKPENRNLNRYGNIIAYDHSRVKLENFGDSGTDYINANYIDAYHRPGAWIATQGPSKHTYEHMWHMVWQERSHRIIMVTNLIEDGRHKCDQYWPETGSKTYGKISVEKLEEEQYADFTIRTFNMTKEGEDLRIVRQFHFTAWPDHGCPTYATSLIAFRKKVRSFHDPTAGPSVVHCSAGVGRTGTFIALDYLLDMAKTENLVDIYNTVHLMRSKRVNMVQTQEQYEFVYEALLEALKSGDTAIPCRDFRKRYLDLLRVNPETGKQRLAEEYELLSIMTPPVTRTGCKDAVDPENVPKNRSQELIPLDNLARPYLMTYIPGSSDYINAVFSDGYKHRDAFIITQMPLPGTVVDFWAMCYDHECSAIVMMNELDTSDETCACYYPVQSGSQVHGPFTIETVALDTNYTDITVRDIMLSYNKKGSEPRSVRQFQYHTWAKDQPLPLKRSSIIQLLQLIEKWQQRSGNKTIVVHCMDGATRSGLLCAITYMIERLKVEQEVDVFNSVKHTRINRPQLIPNLEQFKFIYEMAEEYMDCFETYSNFK